MFYSWIFLVGKFGLKVFLGGALIQVKICFDIQVTGDNQKSFLSLKCSIPGFFWWENLV